MVGVHLSARLAGKTERDRKKELNQPSTKMDEVRKYLKADGSPVDDPATGKPYSLRAVAKLVGCAEGHVR